MGLSSIGYKDGNYISLIHIRYDVDNDELVSLPIERYNSISNNHNSQYYKVLDYLLANVFSKVHQCFIYCLHNSLFLI